MNKEIKFIVGVLLLFLVTTQQASAINFSEYRDSVYLDSTVVLDVNFDGKANFLYFFRITNVGELEGKLKKDFISMPLHWEFGPSCEVVDSQNSKFPLFGDGENWYLKFPPQPVQWDIGNPYYVVISCEEPYELDFNKNGLYILKIEGVRHPFNKDFFDKSTLIINLPDSFWHNTDFVSSSPEPEMILNDNGRLSLVFSREQIVKNNKVFIPVVIVKKNIDWNLILNLLIALFLAILSWGHIKKISKHCRLLFSFLFKKFREELAQVLAKFKK